MEVIPAGTTKLLTPTVENNEEPGTGAGTVTVTGRTLAVPVTLPTLTERFEKTDTEPILAVALTPPTSSGVVFDTLPTLAVP
jgi:hypothetical protein